MVDEPPARHTRPADMTSGARRCQRLENAAGHSGQVPLSSQAALPTTGRASSAPPSFDDPDPPIKNRMLHLVEMKEELAEARARHASQSAKASPPQAVAASSGEPKAKSLGAAESKSKALAFVGTLGAQQSFLQGRPPSLPNTKDLVRVTCTQPRENCTVTDCIQLNQCGGQRAGPGIRDRGDQRSCRSHGDGQREARAFCPSSTASVQHTLHWASSQASPCRSKPTRSASPCSELTSPTSSSSAAATCMPRRSSWSASRRQQLRVSAGTVASAGPCKLNDSVRRGDRKVPTFTTPATEPGGRGAPEGSLQRCSEGARCGGMGTFAGSCRGNTSPTRCCPPRRSIASTCPLPSRRCSWASSRDSCPSARTRT